MCRLLSIFFIAYLVLVGLGSVALGDVVAPPQPQPYPHVLDASIVLSYKAHDKIDFILRFSGPCNYHYTIYDKINKKFIASYDKTNEKFRAPYNKVGKNSYLFKRGYSYEFKPIDINICSININDIDSTEFHYIIDGYAMYFNYEKHTILKKYNIKHPIYGEYEKVEEEEIWSLKDMHGEKINFNGDVHIVKNDDKNSSNVKINNYIFEDGCKKFMLYKNELRRIAR